MLRRLKALAGLDVHVLATLLLRGWTVGAGALTVLLTPYVFSAEEQGYYYTFASLLALQVFFELGLNVVVVQLVSHEFAHLALRADGRIEGPALHRGRLASLLGLLERWYRVAALLFLVGVGAAGAAFFLHQGGFGGDRLAVWLGLVSAYAVILWTSARLAVLEGTGQVGAVARLRLRQSMLGHALMWAALLAGAGLWAVPLMPAVAALFTLVWLRSNGRWLEALRTQPPAEAAPLASVAPATASTPAAAIRWRDDILPMQWRIAVSWMSGYLIFSLFTPMLFANQGAAEAGRAGMALTIFSSLLTVGMSWVNAKAPAMGSLIARGERAELNRLFAGLLLRSMGFTAIASLLLLALLAWLQQHGVAFAERLPTPAALACLVVVTLANAFVFAAATYMRAHKEEPMLAVSVVVGLLTLVAVAYGSRHDTLLTLQLYAAVTAGVALPWTALIFRRYWRRSA